MVEAAAAVVEDFLGTGSRIVSLPQFARRSGLPLDHLPRIVRILLEASLRGALSGRLPEDEAAVAATWRPGTDGRSGEIRFPIGRVILQDAAGLPLLVDLAALRDAVAESGGDPQSVQPMTPVDLVIDHSVQIDERGHAGSLAANLAGELRRNEERFAFVRWAEAAFEDLRVVPPGNGIVHQIHMEAIASVVASRDGWLGFDTVIGTDSHTTMIGGLGVLGWGVGGIEAEAALLGIPQSIPMPDVVGLRFVGEVRNPATATDVVLSLTRFLREAGVVGSLIETFGPGCARLSAADRATIANMAPEYGATCVLFPVDGETLNYLLRHGRSADDVATAEAYLRHQGLFGVSPEADAITYSRVLTFDLSTVEPAVAGPSRPQDVVPLSQIGAAFGDRFPEARRNRPEPGGLASGDVVIAAITSCTNTANPAAMMTAGLVAQAAVERGMAVPAHVRTSFAPGSRAVPAYLAGAGLMDPLEALGFHVDAYGCATCVGNSGDLSPQIEAAIKEGGLAVAAVLSGNRNFEARIHTSVRANFLMGPALVVAFALSGRVDLDPDREPLGTDRDGRPVHLRDLWPSSERVADLVRRIPSSPRATTFAPDGWTPGPAPAPHRFAWSPSSTYFVRPPFFGMAEDGSRDVVGARPLLVLSDGVTTDHISPVGRIGPDAAAARYLRDIGVSAQDLNTYASRRGHHEVMKRGTFANPRLANALVPDRCGPWTRHLPSREVGPVDEIAERYRLEGRPSVVVAGRDYGSGSARDWAAKGTRLLGVSAVLARSFERIHRSNLICMGVAPIELETDLVAELDWGAAEDVSIDISYEQPVRPGGRVLVVVRSRSTEIRSGGRLRAYTETELSHLRGGGILPHVRDRVVERSRR